MSWQTVTIEKIKADVPYACVGGPFGSELTTRDYVEEGVPVIRGSNLPMDRSFVDDNFVFVSEQKANALTSNIAHPGDVIFTQRGTLGQVGLIPEDATFDRYVVSQSQMKLTVDKAKASPLFVYYYFRQPAVAAMIKGRAITSGVPHINLGILKNFELVMPPVQDQLRIATFLAEIDRAIENNRRRIELLEQSARLLYKEWFVHLRFPGHEHVKVVHGVPNGWSKVSLGQSVVLNYGKALRADQRIDGPYPVFGSSGIVGAHETAMVKGPAIILGRKGNVGSVFWSPKDFWPIDTVYFVDPERSDLYLYYALQQMQFISTDVAVPGLNRDFACSRPLLIPRSSLVTEFLDYVVPIHEQITRLGEFNAKLVAARDLLLPRLMSGEIEV